MPSMESAVGTTVQDAKARLREREICAVANTVAQKNAADPKCAAEEKCPQKLVHRWMREGVPEFVEERIGDRAAQRKHRKTVRWQRRRHAEQERRSIVRPSRNRR